MEVKILRYTPTRRNVVQAFIDIELDSLIRLNGIHLHRDGSIQSAKLTPLVKGKRMFISAIEILNPSIHALLARDIAAAIEKHLQTLPPDKRSLPPFTDAERKLIQEKSKPVPPAASSQPAPAQEQRAAAIAKKIQTVPFGKSSPGPPCRLLVGYTPRPAVKVRGRGDENQPAH